MNKTFRYQLYPTKKQQRTLRRWLTLCCETYNGALQERRDAYRLAGISLGYAQQCAELPDCKEVCPELAEVNSQVLQDVLRRVDLAFAAFFRRGLAGEQPGYPRYRSRARYDSLTFKQYGNSFSFSRDGKLVLSKIGQVKLVMHRPPKGSPKTALVKRTPTGKWFVSISVEIGEEEAAQQRLPACGQAVGTDVGLKTFAYLSTGEEIANPRFFQTEEAALARTQRKLSRVPGGSQQRKKRRKVVARVHVLVAVDQQFGIHRLVRLLKGCSSWLLRQEFPRLKSRRQTLWTNNYFISTTGGAPLELVKKYIGGQQRG
jgi:putative transposase